MQQDDMQQEQMQQGETAGQVVFYCPMECEGDKTYSEMTTCPVCGMDLVEKGSANGDADHMHEGHDHEGHDHDGHDHGDEGSM
jgi:hypothetical protein